MVVQCCSQPHNLTTAQPQRKFSPNLITHQVPLLAIFTKREAVETFILEGHYYMLLLMFVLNIPL